MKKILVLIAVFVSFTFISCEEDYYEDSFPRDITTGWVEFDSSEQIIFSDIDTLSVAVNYEVPVVQRDVVVDYTVTGVSGQTIGVSEGNFQSTVLKDTRDLVFDIPVDANVTSPYQFSIVVTATSEDPNKVSVDVDGTTRELVVTVLPRNWTGSTFLVSSAEVLNDDSFFENEANILNIFNLELVPEGGNLYSTTTLWGDFVAAATGNPALEGQFPYPGEITINSDSTILVEGTSEDNADEFPGSVDEFLDVETINAINFEDGTMTYHLGQTLFGGGPFIVKVILTPAI